MRAFIMICCEEVASKWPLGMSDEVASVLIPTISSILVFVLGWVITVLYNSSQKRKGIISYRNAVFEWTKLVIDAVQSQKQSLKSLSERLNAAQSIYPERDEVSRSRSDKLKTLSAEQAISVFIENSRNKRKLDDKRTKHSFNLISQYDFLSSIEDSVKECYDAYNHQANDLREQWNGLIINLQHELDAVKPETTKDYNVGSLLRGVIDHYMMTRGRQAVLMGEINDQLIVPLNEAVDKCKLSYPEVRCYQAVYECARKMILLYNQWYALTRGYSEVFGSIVSTIDTSLASLKEAVAYFENSTKVVRWVS